MGEIGERCKYTGEYELELSINVYNKKAGGLATRAIRPINIRMQFTECKCIYECCDYDYGVKSWCPIYLNDITSDYDSPNIIIGYYPCELGWSIDFNSENTRDSDVFDSYEDFLTYNEMKKDFIKPASDLVKVLNRKYFESAGKEASKTGPGKFVIDLIGKSAGNLGSEWAFDELVRLGYFDTEKEFKEKQDSKLQSFMNKCKATCSAKKDTKR